MGKKCALLAVLLGLITAWPAGAAPARAISASNDRAQLEFPTRVTFSVQLQSDAVIKEVVLEYGTEQLTCGKVVARAFPDFKAGKKVTTSWTWEMEQSGSEPPGATIWWRWRVSDHAGQEMLTEPQRVTWIDDVHPWKTVSGASLNLHWYEGDEEFAGALHRSAVAAMAQLERDTGLAPAEDIDLYVYSSPAGLRDAVLYEPQWIGGQAYPEYNIVIVAVGPEELEWGAKVTAHELTHVLVGHLTFSCLGYVPAWLNEGLAVYGQGGFGPSEMEPFEDALASDTLLSVRALAGGFSEDPGSANVAYCQSYSLVHYLLSEYGKAKLLALLGTLSTGVPIDEAMPQVYGLTLEDFEQAWRASVGARPLPGAGQAPTPSPLPTPVPTFALVAMALPTATAQPTAGQGPAVTATPSSTPPPPAAGLPFPWEVLAAAGGVAVVVIAAAVFAVVITRWRRRTP